jgi:murein DD-endopeptidase MepM/ murein hydrolase activator NlpD
MARPSVTCATDRKKVNAGDLIGYAGVSGNAYNVPNPHLHYAVEDPTAPYHPRLRRWVDPTPFLAIDNFNSGSLSGSAPVRLQTLCE